MSRVISYRALRDADRVFIQLSHGPALPGEEQLSGMGGQGAGRSSLLHDIFALLKASQVTRFLLSSTGTRSLAMLTTRPGPSYLERSEMFVPLYVNEPSEAHSFLMNVVFESLVACISGQDNVQSEGFLYLSYPEG